MEKKRHSRLGKGGEKGSICPCPKAVSTELEFLIRFVLRGFQKQGSKQICTKRHLSDLEASKYQVFISFLQNVFILNCKRSTNFVLFWFFVNLILKDMCTVLHVFKPFLVCYFPYFVIFILLCLLAFRCLFSRWEDENLNHLCCFLGFKNARELVNGTYQCQATNVQ